MSTANPYDNHLDETLQRAARYLTRRGAEYMEHPVRLAASVSSTPVRYRRALIAAAAAATLCVTALAGSFIGGTSSGKVNMAKAAWSAVPQSASTAQVEDMKSSCAVDESYIEGLEGGTWDNFPEFLLEPSLVESRGTTVLAVYFTFHHAIICIQFEDRSITKSAISMVWQSNRWREPFALEIRKDSEIMGTMVVGFMPGSKQIMPTDGNKPLNPSSHWAVTIESPGVGRVSASVQQQLKRFVAWMPGSVSGEVSFVDTATGKEQTGVKFDEPKYTKWNVSPVTTIASITTQA